jgi:hypothetical protein
MGVDVVMRRRDVSAQGQREKNIVCLYIKRYASE